MAGIALVHDYITQRGGAERVLLSMVKAFPEAPVYTSMYWPTSTFPEFEAVRPLTLGLNRVSLLRRHHRLALPILASAFSQLSVGADVVLCSSSGWAHGAQTSGRKIVYCHTPARWLYQGNRYLRGRSVAARAALRLFSAPLRRWDRAAACSANLYLTASTTVRDRVWRCYGIKSNVVPAPYAIDPKGPQRAVPGIKPGFLLCVARLLPYKNVDAVIAALDGLPEHRLIVVGHGPDWHRLSRTAPPNVKLLGTVADEELRWLYASCAALVAASYEDYGLFPLEGAAFGKPTCALRWGGFLDTVLEDSTGVFFDQPTPEAIRSAVRRLQALELDGLAIRKHATNYSEERFIARLREIVCSEANR